MLVFSSDIASPSGCSAFCTCSMIDLTFSKRVFDNAIQTSHVVRRFIEKDPASRRSTMFFAPHPTRSTSGSRRQFRTKSTNFSEWWSQPKRVKTSPHRYREALFWGEFLAESSRNPRMHLSPSLSHRWVRDDPKTDKSSSSSS